MTVAAVVLAAGGGTRFRGDVHKLLVQFRGRAIVRWAVDNAVDGALDETVVVTGAVDLTGVLPRGVRVVHNPDWSAGQATSLAAAVDDALGAGHDAIVVGLGDQPTVSPAAWRAVASVVTTGGIAVATYDGARRNPVGLGRDVWPLLPRQGDEGARMLMRGQPEIVTEVACEGAAPADVDTVEDLAEWS